MKDIVVTALLTVAAVPGCVRFVEKFADRGNARIREQVTTVGVTVFLPASGRTLERGGLAAAVPLLLTWLTYGTVRR